MIKFFYNQNKYSNVPYDRKNTKEVENIKTSGCGICSTAMAFNNLIGKELLTISDLASFSISNGARGENGTILEVLLKALCKKYTDFSFKITEKGDELVKHLANGGVAILHQGGNNGYPLFSTGGHYVFAYSINGKNIEVADPAYTSSRYDTVYRKAHIVKKTNTGCIASIDEINKATASPSYYLISYNKKKEQKNAGTQKKGKVIASSLRVRSSASTKDLSNVVGYLKKNDIVVIIGESKNFWQIKYNSSSKTNLVSKDFICII